MTVVVTTNVEDRYRGFLASIMLEVAAGVYLSPLVNSGARSRIWQILSDWHQELGEGSITMVWRDSSRGQDMGLLQLGEPPKELYNHEGFYLVRRTQPFLPPEVL